MGSHVDCADVNESARSQLEFQETFAVGAKRHLIVDAGDHVAEMGRRHVLLCNRLEVEDVEGVLGIRNQIV
jgi:hypothetical protein